jgi:hypothetical protein
MEETLIEAMADTHDHDDAAASSLSVAADSLPPIASHLMLHLYSAHAHSAPLSIAPFLVCFGAGMSRAS